MKTNPRNKVLPDLKGGEMVEHWGGHTGSSHPAQSLATTGKVRNGGVMHGK